MSVSINKVAQLARYSIGDAGHTLYSDYEVMSAVNSAADFVVDKCCQLYVPIMTATVEIELEEREDGLSEGFLPEDFGAVLSIEDSKGRYLVSNYEDSLSLGEYRIEGDKLIAIDTAVTLYYRKSLKNYSSIEEDIEEFPPELTLPMAKITAQIILGALDNAEIEAEKAVRSVKNRRYENNRPPELWGGYNPW